MKSYKDLGIFELSERIRSRELKAIDVVQEYWDRSNKLNPEINAFISFNERALDEAKEIDRALDQKKSVGPMAGIPIGIKDLLCTENLRTTAASKILENFCPPYSATVVTRLKSSGALVLGKTNLDEFAMGSSNETSAFGPVRNPWDKERVPGGSSGGSAAAVAADMVPAAIGTDTGGSIRQPASYCGVVGIKPTYGRVSRYGVIAFASSLDQVGPMAKNVRDSALILECISGFDQRDSTSSQQRVPSYCDNLTDDLSGLTIGRPVEYFSEVVDPEILKTVANAIDVLKSRGARVVDVSIPTVEFGISIYYLVAASEASSNLARYDGVRFGYRSPDAKSIEDVFSQSRGNGFGSEVKRRIMLGTHALSSGYYDDFFIKAGRARRMLQNDFTAAFRQCDVLISPVTPFNAFRIGEQITDPLAMYMCDVHTVATNLAGLPGMSVPAGFSEQGLPIGVQLTARPFEEQSILNAALAIEGHSGLQRRTPYV